MADAAPSLLRVLYHPPAEGAWNMAVDEAILDAVGGGRAPATLRWYAWAEPTVTLGYFQNYEDCLSDLAHLPRVRRLTGGGAIVHDQELTYSMVFPPGGWPMPVIRELVADVHSMVAQQFDSPAAPLALHPGLPKSDPEPFLCFQRRATSDLVCGTMKVLGSAQRNRRGALLQHGSILLATSPATPGLTGLANLGARPHGIDEHSLEYWQHILANRLTLQFADRWNVSWIEGELLAAELEHADLLAESKYCGLTPWNQRRQ